MADTYGTYMRSIAKHPLLSKEEEVLLKQTIEDGIKAKASLADKDFSDNSEQELKWLTQQGDSAFSTFVLSNLRLVVWTAKKYYVPEGMTMMDMVQEGNLGLLRSIEKWDWRKGHRFSTYSTWWIRQAIDRGTSFSRVVRLPEHMRDNVRKLKKESTQFFVENQRTATPAEMAERMNMPEDKYNLVYKQLATVVSLDAPLKNKSSKAEGDSKGLMDLVQTQKHASPDRALLTNTLTEGVHAVVDALPERQAYVLKMRFGLDDGRPKTLQEVGGLMGVTRERVRQIEAKALSELQASLRSRNSILADLREQMLEVEERMDHEGD